MLLWSEIALHAHANKDALSAGLATDAALRRYLGDRDRKTDGIDTCEFTATCRDCTCLVFPRAPSFANGLQAKGNNFCAAQHLA